MTARRLALTDLCYKSQSVVAVPEMALVFDGEVMMELKEYNYFYTDDTSNGGTGLACLTMLPSQGVSLLGSLLQTGRSRTMTYDIGNAKSQQLIFETVAPAAAAAPAAHSLLMMALPLAAWVALHTIRVLDPA